MSTASEIAKRRSIKLTNIELDVNNIETIDDYYNSILNMDSNKSLKEYNSLLDSTDEEFKKETGLTNADLVFLGSATSLQVARIYIINKLTTIEPAGKSKKEKRLHKTQDKILGNFKKDEMQQCGQYYAPINQIIGSHGVPYDTTHFNDTKHDIFKGGNHRFSTLGHDVLLGLIIGTANILTNTITCNKGDQSKLQALNISTYHVLYDTNFQQKKVYSKPKIGNRASTITMFKEVADRIQNEPEAFVAALIKQIIHIGTDMFTPMGLHLPALNILTSTKMTEEITKYISTGDVVKAGTNAEISVVINKMIAALHKIVYKADEELDNKLIEVRTRKIIMYSNTLATASNFIEVGCTNNLNNLDLGGALVTAYRISTDTRIIRDIRHEYLNEKTSQVYKDKMKEYEYLYN